ncbi:DgyrCDS5656 [Dimorphilus gyrociliatus]|uniref:DgyrCDS5656 n=1 Tax=Dimorphilus gyrociliatus TaxID=2664684 RepID=A0A7I8VKP9_9ANNE|nr:DgyrCDS5656 [Dimorphilus gyrociliatus]
MFGKVAKSFLAIIVGGTTVRLSENYIRSFYIDDIEKKHVLITGCDSGFGEKFARQLDAKGVKVIAACLTQTGAEKLKTKCSNQLQTVLLDVTNDKQVNELRSKLEIELKDVGLHALVNNAGISTASIVGELEMYNSDDYRRVLDVNTVAVANLSLRFLPLLSKAEGRIVNVSSAAGRLAEGNNIPYHVSKFATEAFSDCLRIKLRNMNKGVTVHLIEPGFFKTEIINVESTKKLVKKGLERIPIDKRQGLDEEIYVNQYVKALTAINDNASSNIEEVTNAYEHAIFSKWPKRRYPIGFDCKYIAIPISLLPSWISDYIMIKPKD